MQVLPRWRNVLILKNSLIQTTKIVASSQSPDLHLASFHSTSICSEKWKNKWNSAGLGRTTGAGLSRTAGAGQEFTGSQQPKKNYIRYATRQKRADSKKALKNLLFYGASESSFENESSAINERWDVGQDDHAEKKSKFKSADRRRTCFRRTMRKMKKQSLYEDYAEGPETVFQATFGNKWYTWSYKQPGKASAFEDMFTRRQETDWSERRHCRWKKQTESENETEFNYESFNVGSYSERTVGSYTERITLGLPPKGPLKIEDVKNAFRASALKWHPDKHQGPSQAVAEEKFKSCVTAYKSLCNAFSPA